MPRIAPAVAVLVVAGFVALPPPASASRVPHRRGFDLFAQRTGEVTAAPAGATGTIPHFHSSFSYQSKRYGYYMVGSDPKGTPAKTVVADVIIPLKFVFSDGSVFDPAPQVPLLESSPLFQATPFRSGTTQYGDAIQRAEFWKYTKGTHYHVLLASPTLLPTQTVSVPAADGYTDTMNGVKVGIVLNTYLAARFRQIDRTSVDPGALSVFFSKNVELYDGNPAHGFAIGFHGAFPNSSGSAVWTYAWASWWTTSGSVPQLDTDPLSHEIAEWYNNPFGGIAGIDNTVPPWAADGYPCNPYLEVGDPVARNVFKKNGYHLQDEAFFSWFARQSPSIGINGLYTYLDTYHSAPPVC